MKKYEKKGLLLNVDLAGNKAGTVLQIEVDKVVHRTPIEKVNEKDEQKFDEVFEFIPVKRYWRDRLKDAPMDSCVEWAEESEATSDDKPKKAAAKKPGKSSGK